MQVSVCFRVKGKQFQLEVKINKMWKVLNVK